MIRYFNVVLLLVFSFFFVGCMQNSRELGPSSYSSRESTSVASIKRGVVISSELITVDHEGTGLGSVAGGIAGGVVGNQMGGGSGKDIMTVAGAIVGSMVGDAASKKQEKAYSYVVELSPSGELVQVVQTGELFPNNAPVFVKTLRSGRVVMSYDSSQGQRYSRPAPTQYQ